MRSRKPVWLESSPVLENVPINNGTGPCLMALQHTWVAKHIAKLLRLGAKSCEIPSNPSANIGRHAICPASGVQSYNGIRSNSPQTLRAESCKHSCMSHSLMSLGPCVCVCARPCDVGRQVTRLQKHMALASLAIGISWQYSWQMLSLESLASLANSNSVRCHEPGCSFESKLESTFPGNVATCGNVRNLHKSLRFLEHLEWRRVPYSRNSPWFWFASAFAFSCTRA